MVARTRLDYSKTLNNSGGVRALNSAIAPEALNDETSTAQEHEHVTSSRQRAESSRHAAQEPVIQQKRPCTAVE